MQTVVTTKRKLKALNFLEVDERKGKKFFLLFFSVSVLPFPLSGVGVCDLWQAQFS